MFPWNLVCIGSYPRWQKLFQSWQNDLVCQVIWKPWQKSWAYETARVPDSGKGFLLFPLPQHAAAAFNWRKRLIWILINFYHVVSFRLDILSDAKHGLCCKFTDGLLAAFWFQMVCCWAGMLTKHACAVLEASLNTAFIAFTDFCGSKKSKIQYKFQTNTIQYSYWAQALPV